MGCDIHTVWQARRNGKWEDVKSNYKENRHYLLFSWLANVRNGFGFAGISTYDPIIPIAQPRGLPADFETEDDRHPTRIECVPDWRLQYWDAADKAHPSIWIGYHSHSWLTADEILAADCPTIIQRTGVVSLEWFKKWDGKTPPEEWSGGIGGKGIVVSPAQRIAPDTTHVQIEWDGPSELGYFVDEVKRMKEIHGEVRVVFGFDS